jgi:hypothetical protein
MEYNFILAIVTGFLIIVSTIITLIKKKTDVIGFMGSSSYWFKTLGMDKKVISVDEAISKTENWIENNVKEDHAVGITDYVNAFYCLKIFQKVREMGYEFVYSHRGTDEVKTTLLGHLERTIGSHAADAGSGEIKCSNGENINIDGGLMIQGVATEKGKEVKSFLEKNGITHLFATGSWREASNSEIHELSEFLGVTIEVITQEKEKDMEKQSFVGAMKILESSINVLGIHAHGNGSSQGDIVENHFGLKKIKTHVKTQIENGTWTMGEVINVKIEGEGRKEMIVFGSLIVKKYIINDMETYILYNM